MLRHAPEDVAKGPSDRPVEDVIIVDCGEVRAPFFFLATSSLIFRSLAPSRVGCRWQTGTPSCRALAGYFLV